MWGTSWQIPRQQCMLHHAVIPTACFTCFKQHMLCVQVRWYSFQFLMEELAEEFQEMHVALTALLIKLPDGVIKLT